MKQVVFSLGLIALIVTIMGCKKPKVPEKKGVHLFYVVLDKSSKYYSSTDATIEENSIEIDSVYLDSLIDFMYRSINYNEMKTDIILFFNYVDLDVRGNKELILKIDGFEEIDTVYRTGSSVISKRSEFEKGIKNKQDAKRNAQAKFEQDKRQLYKDLIPMLERSKHTRGSDCSKTLLMADKKLNNYFIDTTKYTVRNKWIIAFSDLVNNPVNNNPITLTNSVMRPGYSSELPYLPTEMVINLTTQREFELYLENILNQ